jgi:hypothetical protein
MMQVIAISLLISTIGMSERVWSAPEIGEHGPALVAPRSPLAPVEAPGLARELLDEEQAPEQEETSGHGNVDFLPRGPRTPGQAAVRRRAGLIACERFGPSSETGSLRMLC